jgi:hypothetical protein
MVDRKKDVATLTAELERAALRAIRRAYSDANSTHFGARLWRPTFRLTESSARLGAWVRAERCIEIARSLLVEHGWGTVVEVLRHEMAHQYVDEVLCAEERAHGATFREVCAERGIDGRPVGVPEPSAGPTSILDRVAKLLALAESPNEHEAHAAMTAARRLMLKHNLSEVTAAADHCYTHRHLGSPTGRVSEAERVLASILSDHFFVDVIWVPVWRPLEGKRGSVLEACGTLENLEMAEYVHSFLSHTAERLWREHKRASRLPGNRDRRAYVAGVMAGFRDKLRDGEKQDANAGLVWVGDPRLGEFFRRRHPRIRWTHHPSTRGSSAHQHGRTAGQQIVLRRGMQSGPSGRVKLLHR